MVGYQTKSLDVDAGEYLHSVGVNFSCMEENSGGSYTVADKLFDRTVDVDDQVLVFDADEYNLTIYQYFGSTDGWYVLDADGSDYYVASFEISSGDHILYQPTNPDVALTLSGEVAASGTQTVTFTVTDDDYLFALANPFPLDTTIADLNSFCQIDDQVLFFDADEYNLTIFQFFGGTDGWYVLDADGSDYYVTDTSLVVIPAGSGAWLMPTASRTWTVTCNYAD